MTDEPGRKQLCQYRIHPLQHPLGHLSTSPPRQTNTTLTSRRPEGARFRRKFAISCATVVPVFNNFIRLVLVAVATAGFVATVTVSDANVNAQGPASVASTGCDAPTQAPGESTPYFAAAGKGGTYIQDVPVHTGPLPVILNLHGYLEPAVIAHYGTALSVFGAAHGFVTITPQIDEPGLPRWDFSEGSADVAYLSELLTHVESTLCVDRLRIYVAGLSMGAFTASSLACQLSDRIAAIAAVAGLQDFAWCHTTRPVPVIAFHGTADPIVAYTGGLGPLAKLLPSSDHSSGPGPQSIPENAAAWARRNGCDSEPTQRQIAADITVSTYTCPEGASVELYSILGGGHIWPGSTSPLYPAFVVGDNTTSVNADYSIWDFFQAHPLRA